MTTLIPTEAVVEAEQKVKRLGRELATALDEYLRASNSVGLPVSVSVYPASVFGKNEWLELPTLN